MNPDVILGTSLLTSALSAALRSLVLERTLQMSAPASLPRTPSIFPALRHKPRGGLTSSWAFRSQLSLTFPSRLHKGHHAICFSSRTFSKLSLRIFFNYTFFLLKPHGRSWETGKRRQQWRNKGGKQICAFSSKCLLSSPKIWIVAKILQWKSTGTSIF